MGTFFQKSECVHSKIFQNVEKFLNLIKFVQNVILDAEISGRNLWLPKKHIICVGNETQKCTFLKNNSGKCSQLWEMIDSMYIDTCMTVYDEYIVMFKLDLLHWL